MYEFEYLGTQSLPNGKSRVSFAYRKANPNIAAEITDLDAVKKYDPDQERDVAPHRFIEDGRGLIIERPAVKFDPDQDRDDRGRWTAGGGDVIDTLAILDRKGELVAGVPREDFEALYNYFGQEDSRKINAVLRGTNSYSAETTTRLEREAKALTEAFDRRAQPVPSDVVAYRALTVSAERVFGQLTWGDIVTDKGFVSTTLDTEHQFLVQDPDAHVLEIHIPKGTKAVAYRPERELLLRAGTRMKVVATPFDHDRFVLEVLPEVEKYDPDQDRDDRGRWSDSGMLESVGGLEGAEVFIPPGGLQVYRGSSTKYLESLKTEGLKSLRDLTGNKEHLIGARGESVFVTDDVGTANSYAKMAAANHPGTQPLLIEINLPPSARAKKDPWTERALMVDKGIPPAWISRISLDGGKSWKGINKRGGKWYAVVLVKSPEDES